MFGAFAITKWTVTWLGMPIGDSSYIFQKNALGMSWQVFSPHLFSRLPVAGIHL